MAAGRRGGFLDQELRMRDYDFESSRKRAPYPEREPGRSSRDSRDRRDSSSSRVRVRDSISKEESSVREVTNGSLRLSSSGTSISSGDRCDHRKRSHRLSSGDREPGELSSGSSSSSDDDDREHDHLRRSPLMSGAGDRKLPNGVSSLSYSPTTTSAKKRKFSPIVWDREDEARKQQNTPSPPPPLPPPPPPPPAAELPPPPPLPEGFLPLRTSEPLVPVSPLPLESPLNERAVDGGDHDCEATAHTLGEDYEYAPARHISSSRWATDANGDFDDNEGMEEENGGAQRKKGTPQEISKLNKRVPTPELGEVLARERTGEAAGSRRSNSGSEDGGLYPEFEVNKKDYMDVDGEDNYRDADNSVSDDGSESENDVVKVSDPVQPPQRIINMLRGCRSVDEFERLNKIDEGTYGVVYRARDKKTGEVVALKKVKMEKEREGFPMTSLREINILLSFHHPSIVDVKEVVVGSSLDSIFMVMEYMEHDLKGLMESIKQPFSQSEVKCLMLQLLEGVKYLHDNWVLHRDLKTSNLLFNNRGELKICDFGLARQYGSPLKPYTHLVVTLWYRSPELLLGMREYSTAIDMWSLGCIMAELLAKEPLFNGKTEFDQLDKIFRILGTPNEKIWPGFSKLPGVKVNFVKQPYNRLREKFPPTSFSGRPTLSEKGFDLLNKLLTYDPQKRISAEIALNHEWFKEVPLPKSKDFMPTFPAQHAQDRRLRRILKSPDPLEEQRRKELQQGDVGAGSLFG